MLLGQSHFGQFFTSTCDFGVLKNFVVDVVDTQSRHVECNAKTIYQGAVSAFFFGAFVTGDECNT